MCNVEIDFTDKRGSKKVNLKEEIVKNKNFINNFYQEIDEDDSYDGSHTMNELYFNRMILFDILCKLFPDNAWKSKLHADGTMFPHYFIVGVNTPEGSFTFHYHQDFWDVFSCKEIDKAPIWDGHQTKDIGRLYSLINKK